MQKSFEIEQGIPEIWGFKGLEMILLRETKKEEKIPLHCGSVRECFKTQFFKSRIVHLLEKARRMGPIGNRVSPWACLRAPIRPPAKLVQYRGS